MELKKILTGLILFFSISSRGQAPQQPNSSEIKLGLEKLQVVGSVLYVAAHPDDENTRLLAYLARERKLRTGYLSLTRGDGGQNLIGNEQAELLGLIRTQELLAARRVDGAKQFFTRANDFGFSKTSEETLKIWNKEQILSDAVWVIRNFQPDVIITRFPEDARAGHGHHASSAILAREAFSAAADPKRFPEQLKFVKPWQAKRILWNTFNFGGNNTTSDDQLKINIGLYNPLLGKSYGEIAAESRSNHKSQGFGSANQRGDATEFFSHVAGERATTDLFDGINFNWSRIRGSEKISNIINQVNDEFDFLSPWKSVDKLLQLKQELKRVEAAAKRQQEVDELIAACLGLWLEVNTAEAVYSVNDSLQVRLEAIARVPNNFKYTVSISESLTNTSETILTPNRPFQKTQKVFLKDRQITQPYWLTKNNDIGTYVVDELKLVGTPENAAAYTGTFSVKIGEHLLELTRPVQFKYVDQVRGEVYQPLTIAPPVTATLSEKAFIFIPNETKKINVQLKSFENNAAGVLRPLVPKGWKISPETYAFRFEKKGPEETVTFTVSPGTSAAEGNLQLELTGSNKVYNRGYKTIGYEHIPLQTLFPLSQAPLRKVDLKFAGKKIGYLPGAGDLVPESLKQVGFEVSVLSEESLSATDLSAFDAIITGVRYYNTSNNAQSLQPKLLEYVNKGGVLLVQYNVNSPLKIQNMGPYPFKLSRSRVTQEDAAVRINGDLPALNFPNKITGKDFEGWIQERGLYFASDIDSRYAAPLSMNDVNESPDSGSLLIAEYGKGRFVYTSLSFFRQLPAGVPGAYRLFVNLLSKTR